MTERPDPKTPEADVDRARRRLLRAGAYAAPAIVGTLLTRHASAQTSCGPANCNPNGGICGPISCNPRP